MHQRVHPAKCQQVPAHLHQIPRTARNTTLRKLKKNLFKPITYTLKTMPDFTREEIQRALLYGAKPNLAGANLEGVDLSGLMLAGATLSGANLEKADLYGANLYGANLSGANLKKADLRNTDLNNANLYYADLEGANLDDAQRETWMLFKTNLEGAITEDGQVYGKDVSIPQYDTPQW